MTEKTFQRQVIALLKNKGFYVLNIEGIIGAPDIIFCAYHYFWGLELKMPGNKVSPQQQWHLKQITKNGGQSYVLTYHQKWKQQLINILKEIENENNIWRVI